MKLEHYVDRRRGRQTTLARDLGVDPQLVWQWSRGVRPVPVIRCVAIELATKRQVMRWDLRPDDWWEHWPELVGTKGAPRLQQAA
ncbi:hypothetical protein CS062_17415 [Roseateles chitinivorans]|uniref:Helix-turn-helix domain-containing protein n=1 Tax=Roseateles chitinivorans TaxID=2917965 RepID=A0A2G9C8E9_9BURK|nr:YdaS family helix-turn-helix protein [Roseateles chitinivorans]PIM51904.1 hypothetical protein CS062_17415 [Roseateles chitinivorans]